MVLLAVMLGGFGYGYLILPVAYNIKSNEALYNDTIANIPQAQQDMVTNFKNDFYTLVFYLPFPILGMIAIYAIFNGQRQQVQY